MSRPTETPPALRASAVTAAPRRWSAKARWGGILVTLLILASLGGLAWYLLHRPTASSTSGPPGMGRGGPATTVGIATAAREDVAIWLDALGTVTPLATVRVRPQVSGVLQQVLFQEGQIVRQGQLLATIDPRPFELALEQARGQRLRDEAQLENAKLILQRYQTLLSQDSIARQDVDTQVAQVKQLEGTVAIDRAAEGTAQLNLGYTRITAPITGRMGLRAVDIGNTVSTSDANGIGLITQMAPMDVQFALPQDNVPLLQQRLSSGAKLEVIALDRTRTVTLQKGSFFSLDNQVDVQTGTVKAKARFANPDQTLFPSQFVNVRVLANTVKDAVVVPVSAVRYGGQSEFVYVLQADRTVKVRQVKRGSATVDKVVIAQGLQVGERVITEGADRLKDGARVVLPGDAPRVRGGSGREGESGRTGGRRQRASAPEAQR